MKLNISKVNSNIHQSTYYIPESYSRLIRCLLPYEVVQSRVLMARLVMTIEYDNNYALLGKRFEYVITRVVISFEYEYLNNLRIKLLMSNSNTVILDNFESYELSYTSTSSFSMMIRAITTSDITSIYNELPEELSKYILEHEKLIDDATRINQGKG